MTGPRMIRQWLSAMAVLGWPLVSFASASSATLAVRLEAPSVRGGIVVWLFDSPEGFEGFRLPVRTERFVPAQGEDLLISNLSTGIYALAVFQDENGNGRLDVNFIGIPREPIGFANAYRPRGPPGFAGAAVRIAAGVTNAVDVALSRPLGRRGRLGIGAGVLVRGNPYALADGMTVKVIPAVTYVGNRLQIFGPAARLGIAGDGRWRLAATLVYRMGVYEAADSPALSGMADRKDTALAGLRLQWNAPGGVVFQAGYEHDALDRIGGGQAQWALSRTIPWRRLRVTPSVALNWMSASLARHDFGVTRSETQPRRPAYRPGDALGMEAGLGLFVELTPSVTAVFNAGMEWLDDEIRRSPIVADDHVFKGFAFITTLL